MVRQLAVIAGSVGLSLSVAASAVAQSKGSRPGVQLGPVAGVNIFTFGGSGAAGAKSRTTFYVGGALTIPLGEHAFVQPELLYAGKGASTSVFDSTLGTISGELKLTYVEVPVLFGFNIGAGGGVRPRIYAGPTVGYNSSCDISASVAGLSFSTPCSGTGTSVKSIDFGVTGGGGVTIPVGRGALSFDARYTLGLTTVAEGAETKNQGISVGAGFAFPLGGK